jgi:hypothetical protein
MLRRSIGPNPPLLQKNPAATCGRRINRGFLKKTESATWEGFSDRLGDETSETLLGKTPDSVNSFDSPQFQAAQR